MISIEYFKKMVVEHLGRDINQNEAHRLAVEHSDPRVLLLVAGPGSGKTTALVLIGLRQVFVDNIYPENILLTTFTRKAAKELRTRWLDWGNELIEKLGEFPEFQDALENIDLNRCQIDTLDSVAQQALIDFHGPGELAPNILDEAASRLLLRRTTFREHYRQNKEKLDRLFSNYTFSGDPPRNQGEALSVTKTLYERLIQDQVDLQSFRRESEENEVLTRLVEQFKNLQKRNNLLDFATMEEEFLERLHSGYLNEWLSSSSSILIDEYQDTNPIQEKIYFEIIKKGSIPATVVGDDDQAMYRFRGGSVELFTQFPQRCGEITNREVRRIDLAVNYRSTQEIVNFYNAHIKSDPHFQSARIDPPKEPVFSNRGSSNFPILGMFRSDASTLARDLASWLDNLVTNRRFSLQDMGPWDDLILTEEGDLGDCVFLSHTVEELRYDRFGSDINQRFPHLLRKELEGKNRPVFNPRGQALRTIQDVQILLGLLLLSLDPHQEREQNVYPTREASYFLNEWRSAASRYIAQDPEPSDGGGLKSFVEEWQLASEGYPRKEFPQDWPALELIFTLIAWIPGFQGDPEHQVWLEVITRTLSSSGMASAYGMQILQNGEHLNRSREVLIRDALLPIAENGVDVDEDIMVSIPRTRLPFMTIHQSKGLEFPLVVVDVGSEFTRNHPTQAFRRFPREASNVVKLENSVEQHLEGSLRSNRSSINRTFDDLIRLYYVAFSRPQSVLMLVGNEKNLKYGNKNEAKGGAIPNVALGWARNGSWWWRQEYQNRKPVLVEPPLVMV